MSRVDKDGNTSRVLLPSLNKERLRAAMLILRIGFCFPKFNRGRMTLSIPADAPSKQHAPHLPYQNACSPQSGVPIKPLNLFACVFDVFLRLHPHVENGTVPAGTDYFVVHAALATLTLSP